MARDAWPATNSCSARRAAAMSASWSGEDDEGGEATSRAASRSGDREAADRLAEERESPVMSSSEPVEHTESVSVNWAAVARRRGTKPESLRAWARRWKRALRPAAPPRGRPGMVNTSWGRIHRAQIQAATRRSSIGSACRAAESPVSTSRQRTVHSGTAEICTRLMSRPRRAIERAQPRTFVSSSQDAHGWRTEDGERGAAATGRDGEGPLPDCDEGETGHAAGGG